MLHPILRYPIGQDTSQGDISSSNESNGAVKIRIMRMKAKSQSQSSLFQNQTDRSTVGLDTNRDLQVKRHQSFHEPSCGINTIQQNQSLLLGNQHKHVAIQQSIQDMIRKKGAHHSFSTSSNQQAYNATKQQHNYQPINTSAKSNNNYNNNSKTISTSTGQVPALNQSSQSTAQLLPYQSQQISLNRSHCSMSFATNRGKSYSMGVTATSTTAKPSFYHHSNIFSLKQYKNITGYGMADTGEADDDNSDAMKDKQRSLLIRQFRHKVGQYLLMAKYRKDQAIKEFNGYYKTLEEQGLNSSSQRRKNMKEENSSEVGVKLMNRTKVSLKNRRDSYGDVTAGGISFLSSRGMMLSNAGSPQQKQLLPDDVNQSLSMIQQNATDLNRYLVNLNSSRFNYSKLSKQEASMTTVVDNNVNNIDVYLEDSIGNHRSTLNAAKRFDHSKLQDMVLDKIAKVIPHDIEYDQKIQRYAEEYERILQKLTNKQKEFKGGLADILVYYLCCCSVKRSFRIKVPEHYEPQMQPFNEFYVIGEKKVKKTKDQRTRREIEEEDQIPWNQINDLVIAQVLREEEEKEEDAKLNEEQSQFDIDQRQKVKGVRKVVINGRQGSQIDKLIDSIGDKKKEEKQKSSENYNRGIKQEDAQSGRNIGGQVHEHGAFTQRQGNSYDSEIPQSAAVDGEGSEKKKNPRKMKERSAMEEYIMFRPESAASFATPKKPKKKTEEIPLVKVVQTTKINSSQSVAAKKIEIPNIQIPSVANNNDAAEKQQRSNRDTGRSQNTNKPESDRGGEVKETKVVGSNQETASKKQVSITIPKKEEENKQQVTVKEKNRDSNMKTDQIQEVTEIDKSAVKTGDVVVSSIAGTKSSQGISEIKPSSHKINDSHSAGSDLPSSNDSQQPIYTQGMNVPKRNDKEQDKDEVVDKLNDSVVLHNPGLIPGTSTRDRQISRHAGNTTSLTVNDNPMEFQQSEDTYFNEMSPKKRIGTGLIDELVKINYLLDFDLKEFKKDRKAPELPQELEFKRAEERLLFDQIFQWQYEVDLDIQEIEEKLNIPVQNRKRHNSEDDDDDDDDEHDHNSNASVHSSEITDFGPAPPLRNDVEDDDEDDFDDEEFSDGNE